MLQLAIEVRSHIKVLCPFSRHDLELILVKLSEMSNILFVDIPHGTVQLAGNRIWIEVFAEDFNSAGKAFIKFLLKIRFKDTSLNMKDQELDLPIQGTKTRDSKTVHYTMFPINSSVNIFRKNDFNWPISGVSHNRHTAIEIELIPGVSYWQKIDDEWALHEEYQHEDAVDEFVKMQVLKGGINTQFQNELVAANTNFFNAWIKSGKLLSHQPRVKEIVPSCKEKISFIPGNDNVDQGCVKWEAWHNGVKSSGFKVLDGGGNNQQEVNTDPVTLGISTEGLQRYRVRIVMDDTIHQQNNVYVSEWQEYIIDYTPHETVTHFYFLNSLNGIDPIFLTGELDTLGNTEGKKYVLPYSSSQSVFQGTVVNDRKLLEWQFKINTGYLSKKKSLWLADMLASSNVWMIRNGKVLPVTIENGKTLLTNSAEDLSDKEIEFSIAHNDRYL